MPPRSQPASEPPRSETTEPSYSETTTHRIQTTTTPTSQHTRVHNQPLSMHTVTNIAVSESEKAASTILDILPWVLMGMMAVLFSTLLIANIICCMVFASRQYKKKQYRLESNPCYISTSGPVNGYNFEIVDHIYAVPTK